MYFNKLKDLKLTISTSIDEQEIIAKFFISFEKLITLHQQEPFLCENSVNGGGKLCSQ